MKKIKYIIPVWSMCYLTNDDPSGMEDDDIAKVDRFVKREGIQTVCCPDWEEESSFYKSNDICSLGAFCYELNCIVKE